MARRITKALWAAMRIHEHNQKRRALGRVPPVVELSSYLGQVATRTYLPDFSNTTNKQMRGRSAHIAMDTIVNPTIRFPNFFVDGFGGTATYQEKGLGAASTITAAIEYPLGTFTRISFGGVNSGSIPNLSYLDGACTITIPKGAWFGVRFFITNTAGIMFCLGLGGNVPGNYQFGDVLDSAASGLTDNTMGGAYTSTSGTSRYSPIIIAAQTTLPSVLVIGDSKSYGETDTGDAAGAIGEVQRWISPYFANANWGIRGRDASQFVANSAIQSSMASFFTHLVNEDGVNGFIHGRTAAQVAADTDALAAKFPTLKKYITTILPVATSTDNYATTANQTTVSYNVGRITENNRRRGVPSPWLGCFDSADALESARDSGLVKPARGYFTSASSVHPARMGYVRVAEFNRAKAATTINRDGVPLALDPQVYINQFDHAEDETDLATYTFANKGFLIGTANQYRRVFAAFTARLGTASATLNSVTIGGIPAVKVGEVLNTTGGALTIMSVWSAVVPNGDTATISATFSTAMLRCGVDVWTAVGDNAVPTVSASVNNAGAAAVATTPALNVPSRGGAIVFSSVVNGTVPTLTATNQVTVLQPTLVGGTLSYSSGSTNQAGSKTFSATWAAGSVATSIAIAIGP